MLRVVVKRAKEIERSLNLTILVTFCAIGVFHHQSAALSQPKNLVAMNPGDLICYMQTSDGRVLNLSKLCGGRSKITSTLSATDQRFLNRYQMLLSKRTGSSPVVQAALSQAQQSPQAIIQRAQAICTAIRSGQPQPSLGQVDDDLFQTMAPRYYCPELDD